MVRERFGQYGEEKKDRINEGWMAGEGVWTHAQSNQRFRALALEGRDSLEGETWLSSLEITSSSGETYKSTKTLPRYFIMPYQMPFCLITLYTHLNTDTHFWTHCSHWNKGRKGRDTFCTRWKTSARFLVYFLPELHLFKGAIRKLLGLRIMGFICNTTTNVCIVKKSKVVMSVC